MRTYVEAKDGYFLFDGWGITKSTEDRLYREMISLVNSGQAQIDYYAGSAREAKDIEDQGERDKDAMEKALKLEGVLFNSIMCSATAEDQHGLSDIESFVLAGNAVNFHFENGNKIVLTSSNWSAFRAAWVPFRFGFFPL